LIVLWKYITMHGAMNIKSAIHSLHCCIAVPLLATLTVRYS